jgi:transposase InsO family protein
MLTRLHANATTTPKVRAEIQASLEPVAVLAVRYGVSETTIRRWRSRTSPEDRSHKRHNLGQATTPLEEEIIAGLRRLARLSLDDITEVMNRCINPRLSRGSVWTALRRAGLSGRLRAAGVEPGTERPAPFEATPFGYVHVDLRYLARLDGRGEYVFVAIERMTRFAWIEIMPDRSAARVAAAMTRFLTAFGHPVHTVLTDNGSEFTDRFGGDVRVRQAKPSGRHAFDRLCAAHGIEHRLTRPYTPKTNGMVERFNRRIGEAISGAMQFRKDPHRRGTFQSHAERAAFLTDFVDAYNRTRLRCIGYKTPSELLNNQIGDNTWAGAETRLPRGDERSEIVRWGLLNKSRVSDSLRLSVIERR